MGFMGLAAELFLDRRTPLVLLTVMVLIGLLIEWLWWPPLRWEVKVPVLVLLVWGLSPRRAALEKPETSSPAS